MLRLDKTAQDKLSALRSGRGNRKGLGVFTTTRRNCKITPNQLLKVKEYNGLNWTQSKIQMELKLSEYIVKRAIEGKYDHILPPERPKRRI